jgi:hypothetical protein
MNMIGRILLILAVFALVMEITYAIVNSRSPSGAGFTQRFEPGNRQFASPQGAAPGFQNGERPEFPSEGRNEFRGERSGGRSLFGAFRNIAIIGTIVAMIVLPKAWIQKRKREAQITAG